MKHQLETITPQVAAKYLLLNTDNRPMHSTYVDYLSRQMQEGLWKEESGESIKFSSEGVLLDGQHRLAALIKANKPLKFLVVRDIDKSVFTVLDTGKKRSASDSLYMQGETRGKLVASIISMALSIQAGVVRDNTKGRYKSTNTEISNIYKERAEYWQHVARVSDAYRKTFKILTATTYGGFYHCFAQNNDEEKVKSFFDKLCTGVGLEKSSPILLLRNRMIDESSSLQKSSNMVIRALVIKAWNAYVNGEVLKILRWNAKVEEFPKIL